MLKKKKIKETNPNNKNLSILVFFFLSFVDEIFKDVLVK